MAGPGSDGTGTATRTESRVRVKSRVELGGAHCAAGPRPAAAWPSELYGARARFKFVKSPARPGSLPLTEYCQADSRRLADSDSLSGTVRSVQASSRLPAAAAGPPGPAIHIDGHHDVRTRGRPQTCTQT